MVKANLISLDSHNLNYVAALHDTLQRVPSIHKIQHWKGCVESVGECNSAT